MATHPVIVALQPSLPQQNPAFDLIVPASELQNLPDDKRYLRTLIEGRPHDPARVDAFPRLSVVGNGSTHRRTRRERVTRTSLERYGRNRANVEVELKRFLSAA